MLADDFAEAALRVEPVDFAAALRALVDFAGVDAVDDEACAREALEAEWPLDGPLSAPVLAEATAAPATMAAPTPRVTAPAFSHIRVLGPRRLPAPST